MTAINSNRAIRGPVTAVPVVAGTGVRLVADTENNRVVAEVDETVLYTSTFADAGGDVSLSESAENFQYIQITYMIESNVDWYAPVETKIVDVATMLASSTTNRKISLDSVFTIVSDGNHYEIRNAMFTMNASTLVLNSVVKSLDYGGRDNMSSSAAKVLKVIGINRVSASA